MSIDTSLLFQNMKEAVVMLDKQGYITFGNKAASSISGYDQHDLLRQTYAIFDPASGGLLNNRQELDIALKQGAHVSEGWKLKKDKTTFWAKTVITPLYDDRREHQGYSYILNDICTTHPYELTPQESGSRYRSMIESIADYSICLLNTAGYIQTWNLGGINILGYSSSEIINQHYSIFYSADEIAKELPEKILDYAKTNGRHEEDGWRLKKNGSVFRASVITIALYNDQGEHIGFSLHTRDLTGRQKSADLLRESEERYRSLVEQVTDYGIFMLNNTGDIVSWNEGARKIKGYSAQEIIGQHFSIFYPQEDILNGKPSLELEIAKMDGKYEEEGWRIRKNGSKFWANVVITAVYNPSRKLIGFSKVTRDLTERKRNEENLQRSFEKYRELAEKFKAANIELSTVNQELEQFTATVSHDLLEPLRTAKSFLYLVSTKLSKKEFDDLNIYVDKSVKAVDRMKALIDSLLNYARVSKGEIDKKPLKISDLIDQVLSNMDGSIKQSGARIHQQISSTTIIGDSDQLVQLMQNLLSNSLKFIDNRIPQINIIVEEDHDFVKFAIEDNGIGIEKDGLGKIFDVFRRLHTTKEYPGTGIGLALCKKIVERHHGQIWIESQKDVGTTFFFTIPKSLSINK